MADDVDKTTPSVRSPSSHLIQEGDVLSGRYRLLRFVAAGGMGEVWEAEDQTLHERVALKTVRPDAVDAHSLERLRSEVRLARRIGHRNVCRVFEFGEHVIGNETVSFLTMELLSGQPLSDFLASRGPLAPDDALPLLRQMALALDAAHQVGIVHRDFKCPNVFLEPDGASRRVVVTDFGIARHLQGDLRITSTNQVMMGTPGYMAPEQVEGREAGPPADLFALGVVAYELVTGSLPFTGPSAHAVAVKRLSEPPRSPRQLVPSLPLRWEEALLKALARQPADRFASCSDFISALEGTPLTTTPPRAAAPRGKRFRWAVAALGVLALGAAGAWRVMPRQGVAAVVKVDITSRFSGVPEWYPLAVKQLFEWDLRQRVGGLVVDDAAGDALAIELQRSPEGQRCSARLHEKTVGPFTAPSVRECSEQLAEALRGALEAKAPTAAEATLMARWGAKRVETVRAFERISRDYQRAGFVEPGPLRETLELVVAAEPDVLRPYLLLCLMDWTHCLVHLEPGLARGGPPHEHTLLLAVKAYFENHPDEVARLLDGLGQECDRDSLCLLVSNWVGDERASPPLAVLAQRHPDLWFAADGLLSLRGPARTAALGAWFREQPGQEQAFLAYQADLSTQGRLEEARRGVGLYLELFGRDPSRAANAASLAAAVGLFREVEPLLEVTVRPGPSQARALYAAGVAAELEGRFTVAVRFFSRAVQLGALAGNDGDTTQALESLVSIAERTRQRPAQEAALAQLQDWYGRFSGVQVFVPPTKYLLARIRDGRCPDIDALTAEGSPGARDLTHRSLVRLAADTGCGACDAVWSAGTEEREVSTRLLVAYARCAKKTGHADEAVRAYRDASLYFLRAVHDYVRRDAPLDSAFARFELAQYLEELKRPDEALAEYTRFLEFFGRADRPIPELELARAASARLQHHE